MHSTCHLSLCVTGNCHSISKVTVMHRMYAAAFGWRSNMSRAHYVKSIQNHCRYFTSESNPIESSIRFANGRTLYLSSGKYARFANGTAECRMGDTSVMVTAVSQDKPSGAGFMPLTVDFRQKYAAAGRIPMNMVRRELGKTDKEILSARLIDRSLRPLFASNFRYETQLVCNMLALDSMYSPDVLSINAASLALALSDIPWNGPIAAVRLGIIDNEILLNPTRRELHNSTLDLILSATKQDLVVMLEGKASSLPYQDVVAAIRKGLIECRQIIAGIEKMQASHGKPKREIVDAEPMQQEVIDACRSMCVMRIRETFSDESHDKISRDKAITAIRESVVKEIWSNYPTLDPNIIGEKFNEISKEIFREQIFQNKRCDGRQLDELRPISCKVDLYEPLHGSALFQRGQTQVMANVSLDSIESALKLDSLSALDAGVKSKNFFLHYEFPPYATGEIGRIGPVGRREIGHGALAEKALLPVIPNDYPFTIRLTSEVLESNGSSSMATVCAGSMALLDAGVPIASSVAGVAIGLVTKYLQNDPYKLEDYRLLTDILGIEDYLGDMDMKVAATKQGLTAIQADIKTYGIPIKVINEALERAMTAKRNILKIMADCIEMPHTVTRQSWPVSDKLKIEPEQRMRLIGPGGMHLKRIFAETGVQFTQIDEATFNVFAPSQSAMDEAMEMVKILMKKDNAPNLEFGAIYSASIVEIRDIGVFVKLYDTHTPTLVHVSQLDARKVGSPSALGLKVGDVIQVKFFGYDPVSGYMRLSRKAITSLSNNVTKDNITAEENK